MSSQVLVIDDDRAIQRLIEKTLLVSGHTVQAAGSAADGFALMGRTEPDLVLLDIGLPDLDGLELCRRIRARSAVPIICLTGRRNETDIVAGLEAGADDYVTKPFSPRELLARVEALLRRHPPPSAPGEPTRVVLAGGHLVLDFAAQTVQAGQGEQVLTPREFAILGYLVRYAGRMVSHDELIRHVWGESDPSRKVDLRTYVKFIRRKIEPVPSRPRYLLARSGAGYYVVPASTPVG